MRNDGDRSMTLATHRWTIQDRVLVLADGTEWKLPRRMPDNVLHEIARLPHDYIELGNFLTDLQETARLAERDAQTARDEVAGYKMKYDNIKNQDIESLDKIVAVLSDDLEQACNLLIRISVALGIQPGGEFYNTIRDLVEKYGMKMHYARDYKYEGTITALDEGGSAPVKIEINDQGKVDLISLLPPGEYDIEATDDDPFEYHIHVWEEEGGNGTLHDTSNPDDVLLPNLLDDES
jgi:hypothetical protein